MLQSSATSRSFVYPQHLFLSPGIGITKVIALLSIMEKRKSPGYVEDKLAALAPLLDGSTVGIDDDLFRSDRLGV